MATMPSWQSKGIFDPRVEREYKEIKGQDILSQNSAMAWLLSGYAQESRISRIRRRGNKELNGLEEEINSQQWGRKRVVGGA
ncbi:hypothetical protein Tco_0962974 [Tanacetum coccineum]